MANVQAAARYLRRTHLIALKKPTPRRTEQFTEAVRKFKRKYPDWRDQVDFISLHR